MAGFSQMSIQVLWGKSHTQSVPSTWEIMHQAQEEGSLPEGGHEARRVSQSMKLKYR